jgi:two-component system response regulator AtoC
MSPGMQAKLLRVLESGHYRRVGNTQEQHANVRVIAATNKPLEEDQKNGRFRDDLFYRLNVVSIPLPPLRERPEDIPILIDHFLTSRQMGKTKYRVDPQALDVMVRYHWPGNVRELVNVLERAQILADDDLITTDDLPASRYSVSSDRIIRRLEPSSSPGIAAKRNKWSSNWWRKARMPFATSLSMCLFC